jgi:hypothetical protein
MNSKEIREQMAQVESAETPFNLSPSGVDRETIRAQRQLTLAVLEVALQLSVIDQTLENVRLAISFK